METIDPFTGQLLPPDAIQRILFIAPSVHIYNIPPLTSTKGHVAANWTTDPKRQIFKARLRILETAIPLPGPIPQSPTTAGETVKTDILLEDPTTGELFAASPYTNPAVVEQVLDSSRFFAVTVQGEGGRRAVLGVGFEERNDAFDFSVALQQVRKTLGLEFPGDKRGQARKEKENLEEKRDFSLKEGQTITVNLGGRSGKGRRSEAKSDASSAGGFSLLPPPGVGTLLPPPPTAREVKAQKRLSQTITTPAPGSIEDLGFDDGEFGEFQ